MNENEITHLARQIRLETLKMLTQLALVTTAAVCRLLKPWPCCTAQ